MKQMKFILILWKPSKAKIFQHIINIKSINEMF